MNNRELNEGPARKRRGLLIGLPVAAALAAAAIFTASSSQAIQFAQADEEPAAEEAPADAAPAEDALAPAEETAPPRDAESIARGLVFYRDNLKCVMCHAWDGHVARVEGEPIAADLTRTTLNYDQLIEVVSCGRPATGMPNHLRDSYRAAHPCYGLTFDMMTDDMYPRRPLGQTDAEGIVDVVNYIVDVLVGKEMTFDNCVLYFQREAPQCERFRPQ